MIVVWVIELFMNQMGVLRSNNTSYLHDPQYLELQKQFDSFLAIPKVEVLIISLISMVLSKKVWHRKVYFNFRNV